MNSSTGISELQGCTPDPGAVLAGFFLTGLFAAGVTSNIAFTLIGVLGCLASGLLIFAARRIDTSAHIDDLESATVTDPATVAN